MRTHSANTACNSRTKILLLIPHLGGGGAEHVISLLAQKLSWEKYQLHLALVTAANADAAVAPPWVTVHALNSGRARAGVLRTPTGVAASARRLILSGASEVSILTSLLCPLFPSKTRLLIRQNGTVSSALAFGNTPAYTRWLFRLLASPRRPHHLPVISHG